MNGMKKQSLFAWGRMAFVFIILLGFLVNTIFLGEKLDQVGEQYVYTSNQQIANQLSYRLKTGKEFITDFAESLNLMPESAVTEQFLEKKAESMGFKALLVVSREQIEKASLDGKPLKGFLEEHPEILEEPSVSFWERQGILFTAPVTDSSEEEKLAVGLHSYKGIHSMLRNEESWKNGVRILLDPSDGKILIMEQGKDSTLSQERIERLLEELENQNYTETTMIDSRFVCTQEIEGTDWLQISLIRLDEIISHMSRYVMTYLMLFVAQFLILIIITWHLKENVRKKEQVFMLDPLTGGYNREGFLHYSSRFLAENENSGYVVLCLNMRDFRHVNELWGEESGNKTLQFIYHALTRNIRENEVACRSSMDRFLLFLKEAQDEQVQQRIGEMIGRMNQKISEMYEGYSLHFSVGACRVQKVDEIASAIDNATYAGKQSTEKNVCAFYDEQIRKRIAEENELNNLFEDSLKNHHFQVYLQPKVALDPKKPCQAEALVRWIHPEKGMIYPGQFIPLFEKNGNICSLDLYVFEEVCKLLSKWMENNEQTTHISVNISRFHLRNSGAEFWKTYRNIKEKYRIPDGMIELELTESVLLDINQIGFFKEILNHLHSCGFLVALDDFGFAYSSLALLKEFEIDTLKMDRSFFVNETEKSRKIVKNVIRLAHSLDIQVVAEGIEEEEQVTALGGMDCDYIQGYVYSKPVPTDAFEAWREEYER